MVRIQAGQSTLEFIVILAVLTTLGFYIAWKMTGPTQSGGGTMVNVLDNAEKKIGND